MVSVFALSVVDRGFKTRSCQRLKLVFAASLLSTQHLIRSKAIYQLYLEGS
jgi:hypothetical protein